MSNELTRAAAFLYATLAGDATLTSDGATGVYQGVADENVAPPYVIFNRMSATDKLNANGRRLFTSQLWQVKVVGLTDSYPTLQTIADRLDALLTLATGTAGGAQILACYREQAIDSDEVDGGQKWSHLGGLYRLIVQ